jgi:protein-S-isoprenylcysteine O-methyltransferase Ste14
VDIFGILQLAALCVIAALFAVKTIGLRKKGIKAFRLGLGRKGLKQYFEILFAFGAVVWAIEISFHAAGRPANILPWFMYLRLYDDLRLKILGAVFLASGAAFAALSMASSGGPRRAGADDAGTGEFITSGIFSFSRNPFYLSVNVISLGYLFINGDVFFICSFFLGAVLLHYQILQEEISLEKAYGDTYRQYKQKVRRYF